MRSMTTRAQPNHPVHIIIVRVMGLYLSPAAAPLAGGRRPDGADPPEVPGPALSVSFDFLFAIHLEVP